MKLTKRFLLFVLFLNRVLSKCRSLKSVCAYIYSDTFTQKVKTTCKTESDSLQSPMIAFRRDYIRYRIEPEEYVYYGFSGKRVLEKKRYMSHKIEQARYFHGSANTFPRSKYERFLIFSRFFLRDVFYISTQDSRCITESEYAYFCRKNPRFIIKPVKGTEGRGIMVISSDTVPTVEALIHQYGDELLLESLIPQGEEMAAFHPKSINTIRFVSALNDDGVYSALFALLRVGVGEAVVDNVGAGGLVAMIDLDTGIVSSDAFCKNHYYMIHPDTGMPFKGFHIPYWNELRKTAEQAHRSYPKQHLIGWDFAWTESGEWDLVEANPTPFFISYQALSGKGIRPLLDSVGI